MSRSQRNNDNLPAMLNDWQNEAKRILAEKVMSGTLEALDLVQFYESNEDFRRLAFKTNSQTVVNNDSILMSFAAANSRYFKDLKNGVEEPVVKLPDEAFMFGKNALMEVLSVQQTKDFNVADPCNKVKGSAANEDFFNDVANNDRSKTGLLTRKLNKRVERRERFLDNFRRERSKTNPKPGFREKDWPARIGCNK